MSEQVFISHAGPDAPRAEAVTHALRGAGFGVMLDRDANRPGDDFLAFMEKALAECDYCLLLWSSAAARREWVRVEWEAALYRTVKEARRFLVIGRLEDHPLPALLAPRLFVELFPDLRPGTDELIGMLREDRAAAESSGRPVGQAAVEVKEDAGGETVYVTSELFRLTMPLKVSLAVPAGVYVSRLVADLQLPQQQDYQGLIGVRYDYALVHENQRLARERGLAEQGVRPNSVLWLEVEMTPFAQRAPVEGTLVPTKYRGRPKREKAELPADARGPLLAALSRAGLGS
jgi:TIR domain